MELGSLIGIIAGISFIFISILITGEWQFGALGEFGDAPSAMVVIGGTFASAFTSVKLKTLITALKAVGIIFKPPAQDSAGAIDTIVKLANTARKEGVLALEDSANNTSDLFLKKGIMLIVDGTDPELVKGIMETELSYVDERHNNISEVFGKMGEYAPAWGMIGTMIGLVLMLGRLEDPGALGPMMAIALITTFYGCVLANYIFAPISYKLKQISQDEVLLKTVMVEGMLSIQAGENPRIIEEKLKSFLAPSLRGSVGAKAAEASE